MKKIYLLLLFTGIVNAQVITITDANFKAKLLAADLTNHIAKDVNDDNIIIDTNGNKEIEQSEALAVYYLNISYSNIASLEGIEEFTNLRNLNCSGNNLLTVLSVSNLINLELLNCSGTQLLSLDTSMLPNLAFIQFGNPSLNSVKLSSNLYQIFCYGGAFTSLDTSNFLNLWRFWSFGTDIPSLDFSTAPNLMSLQCVDNNLLEYIHLKNGPLVEIALTNNPKLTSIDLSGMPNLNTVHFEENNALTTINLQNGSQEQSCNILSNPNLTSVCADVAEVSILQIYFNNTGQTGITVNSNCSLGTQDMAAAAVKIYPNPTTGIIHITAANNFKLVEIYDLQGRLLQTNTVNASTTTIDISARAAGIYLLKVQTANGLRMEKIIKQ